MYSKSSSTTEVASKWTSSFHSLKRLKSQRISPFNANAVEKKVVVVLESPKKKKSKAAFFQKAISNLVQSQQSQQPMTVVNGVEEEEEQVKTPELSSINDQENDTSSVSSSDSNSSYSSGSDSSAYGDDNNSVEIDDVVQRISDEQDGLSTDTDEEDYNDDIVGQALSRILSQKKSATCPEISAVLDRPLPPLPHPQQEEEEEYDQQSGESDDNSSSEEDDDDLLAKSVEIFKAKINTHALLKRYASTTKLTTMAAATNGKVHLKRAATWLGLPVQKLLASPQVQNFGLLMSQKYNSVNMLSSLTGGSNNVPVVLSISNSTLDDDILEEKEKTLVHSKSQEQPFIKELIYGTDSDHFAFLRNQLEQKHSPAATSTRKVSSSGIINKKTFVTPKRIMYCRVMQIINLASTRDCDYELHIQLNNVTLATKRGVLRKIEKNVSADRPQEEALAFEVEEPFSLHFIVAARHTNTLLRDGLAKMGIWPIPASTAPISTKSTEKLPIAGFTCLNFENKMDVLDQGVSRFRLTKPIDKSSNRWLNIELLIDIKVEEVLPAVVHQFPWSYTTELSATSSYQSTDMEDIVACDPKELLVSQEFCRQGDYLTLYTRGLAHPTWKRYWVTMEENQLVLHDFTYKESKEPLSIIPLVPLQAVVKPSVDDCENVGIARKTGILLQFDRSAAMLTEPVRLDCDEGLEGKAYLYGDSEQNTIHWRRALSAYITNEENKNKTTEDGVDLRFLW